MNNEPAVIITPPKNKFKTLTIALAILSAVLAVTAACFAVNFFNQKVEISNLRQSLKDIQADLYNVEARQEIGTDILIDDAEALKADLLQIFETAGNDISGLKINRLEEVDSLSAPYQIVRADIANELDQSTTGAYFYRSGMDGAWKFGFSGDSADTVSCQTFAGERSKVFSQFNCYDYLNEVTTTVSNWSKL